MSEKQSPKPATDIRSEGVSTVYLEVKARELQSQLKRMWPESWTFIDFSVGQPDLYPFEDWLVARGLTARPAFASQIEKPYDWENVLVPYQLYDAALALEQGAQQPQRQDTPGPLTKWDQLQAAIPSGNVVTPAGTDQPSSGGISLAPAGMGTQGRVPPASAHAMKIEPNLLAVFKNYTLQEVASLANALSSSFEVSQPALIRARKYLFFKGHSAAAYMPADEVKAALYREVSERAATGRTPSSSPNRSGQSTVESSPAALQRKPGKAHRQHRAEEERKRLAEEAKQREEEKRQKEADRKKRQAKRKKARETRSNTRSRFTGELHLNVGDGRTGFLVHLVAEVPVARELSQYYMDDYPDELEIHDKEVKEMIRVIYPYAMAPRTLVICDPSDWRGHYVPYETITLRQERCYKELTQLWGALPIGREFGYGNLDQPVQAYRHIGVFPFGPFATLFS